MTFDHIGRDRPRRPGEADQDAQERADQGQSDRLDQELGKARTRTFVGLVEQGWFRPGTRWEQVDMDRSTVLDYPDLQAEELERWARRAFRAWAVSTIARSISGGMTA